ncbi:transposase [Erythrobacter phage vB_EliS-L02]|nr:transposase [Erythrobacter phage vB_EliS-L02]
MFTIGRSSISLFLDNEFYSLDESHPNYQTIRDELKKPVDERDIDLIRKWVSVKRAVEIMTAGKVTVLESEIQFGGKPVHNYMTKRMLDLLMDGFDLTPWVNFMNNLYDNPAEYAHDELYEWMEKADMPLTEDGHFLAFKKVRGNYTDCHTGTFDHSPGNVIEMPRENCDPVRSNTCSTGFHFCSAGYLSSFHGERIVIVKINPRDVTSIPNDYHFTKGRCCRYEVVAELSSQSAAYDKAWKKGVVKLENPAEFPADVLSKITMPSPALNEPVRSTREEWEERDRIGTAECVRRGLITEAQAVEYFDVCKSRYDKIFNAEGELLRHEKHLVEPQPWGAVNYFSDDVIERLLEDIYDASETKEIYGIPVAQLTDEEIDTAVKHYPEADKLRDALWADREAARNASSKTGEDKVDGDEEGLVFRTTDGRTFTAEEIESALEEAKAIRAAARELNIGESTLRGWKKKLEG